MLARYRLFSDWRLHCFHSTWRDPLEVGFAIDGLLDAADPAPTQRFI
jgi:hypothetical protein